MKPNERCVSGKSFTMQWHVFRVFVLGIVLTLAAVSSTGCRLDRLRLAKNSFKDFKNNVVVTSAGDLQIEFKHPILLEEDVLWLGYPRPPDTIQVGSEVRWHYTFRKKNAKAGENAAVVKVTLVFADGLLSRVIIPETIARLIPKDLPEAILTAIGNAEIGWLDQSLVFSSKEGGDPMKGVRLPELDECKEVLGEPFDEKQPTPTTSSLIYIYECEIGGGKMEFAFAGVFRQSFGTMVKATVAFGRYCAVYTSYSIEIRDMLKGPPPAERAGALL